MSDSPCENVKSKHDESVDIDMSVLQHDSKEISSKLNEKAAAGVSHPQTTATPPQRLVEDGGWGWMVVFGSSVCHFFLLGLARTLGIVFILLQEKFGASAKETALVTSIFVSLRACGGPVATTLSDRFGCRKVVIAGGLFLFAGVSLSAFAFNIIYLYISFGVVAGIGAMLVFSPSYIIISYWFDKKRGKAMAFATLGTGLGNIIMAHVMSALVIEYQFFGTMLVVGALMLNNCVGACLYKKPRALSKTKQAKIDEANKTNVGVIDEQIQPEDEEPNLNVTTDEKGAYVQVNTETCDTKESIDNTCARPKCLNSSLWYNFPYILHCATMTGLQGCIQCVLIFLPSYAKELGSTFQQEAWLLTLFGIWDMVGRFVFGFIFDLKFIRTRRTHMYTFVSAGFASFAIITAFTTNYLSLAIVTCFTAFFEGGSHSQRATIIPELVEKSQMSIGIGLGFFFMGLGNFYGPLVGGSLKDATGTYRSCFIFGGSVFLLACIANVLFRIIRSQYRRHVNK